MPTYVYQCIEDDGSEGEIFEVVQPMSADPLTKHPESGQGAPGRAAERARYALKRPRAKKY